MMLEITKLHYLLEDAGIPHTFDKFHPEVFGDDAYQIHLYADAEMKQELDDCIYHRFSHGYDKGLLETYKLNECRGYETADEVFKGWVKMYNPTNKLYDVVVSGCKSYAVFASSEKEAKESALDIAYRECGWDLVAEVVEKV